eukprot:10657019-Ditylum_brightwellii.AAC.1
MSAENTTDSTNVTVRQKPAMETTPTLSDNAMLSTIKESPFSPEVSVIEKEWDYEVPDGSKSSNEEVYALEGYNDDE